VEHKKDLLKLITKREKRSIINSYVRKPEVIKKYLPHLDIDIGRKP
jgi:hypothetical protein